MNYLRTLALALFLWTCPNLQAQDGYQHGIGLRAGNLSGITYKTFLTFPHAIEGILGFNFENGRLVTLTGLYEYHLFINYDLNFFAGGGITFGANSDNFKMIGEGIVGIEYSIPNFPLNFSLDFKPAYSIFDNKFFFNEYALTVRYIL